jgi:transposase-like protein
MPSKAKKIDHDVAKLPSIPKELVELFLTGPMTGEAINDAGVAFKKALIKASLKAELSRHLGYESGSEKPDQATNHRNKAVYLALGVRQDGARETLGLWIENAEGAKFWMKVFNDLRTRRVLDILIAVTDGFKGMPEALGVVFSGDDLADVHRASDPQQS